MGRWFLIYLLGCVFVWAQELNHVEHIKVSPMPDLSTPGVALDLLFAKPLLQTPQISALQTITIQNIAPFAPKLEQFSTSVLKSLNVYPQDNTLLVVPKGAILFDVKAKLSIDKKYLRLEFVPLIPTLKTQTLSTPPTPSTPPKESALNQETALILDYAWKVCAVIGGLLLLLWILKRKGTQKFLFPKVGLEPSVTFIKPLDATHKLVTIEVRNQLYLILLNSNQSLILDKISLDLPLKKDSAQLKEELMEEAKQHIRHSKLRDPYA
ncbi:hypothetical protein FNE76_05260 [Helicobacter mehlei]|uniref:Uncharacterized protein n=1 Tax=Helicobacter mehlei TaxID=2316080 RepID=A0A553USQ2_9HELI|nr:hypothetical protein FNE76_05260 [Helicobacter mehlei]